jgi:hypothetical protein
LDILFVTLTSARAKLLLEDFRSCQTVEALATVLATATDGSNEADWAHAVHFNEKVELHHVKCVMDNVLRRLMDAVVVAPETGELFQRYENDDGDDSDDDDSDNSNNQQKCAADVPS